jgi:hypothetical protein
MDYSIKYSRSQNIGIIGHMFRLNISVTFTGKPIGLEEFFNQMIDTLGITIIDRHSKGRLCKIM